MNITSSVFNDQEMIPSKYTCQGEDSNPPLRISDPPDGTLSLCLIVHDHDAPSGDFVHWLLWNIDPGTQDIKEGAIPTEAVEGMNDFGKTGWGGPCPPSGIHRYEFHLYALDTKIELPASSDKTDLRDAIAGHVLEEASIVGLYEKS